MFGGAFATKALWSKLGEHGKRILYYPYNSAAIFGYIFTIPWQTKLAKSKGVLRHIAAQLNIPAFIINRPKSALGVEPRHWAVSEGWLEPLVALATKVFDETEIRSCQSLNPEMAQTYWNILNYALWKRLIIEKEPLHVLREELEHNRGRVRGG
jgi:hypothetical protein